jgi:hypothetical protein
MKKSDARPTGDFGDQRLSKRHAWLMGQIAASPDASFPEMTRTVAGLEAFYRFVNNDEVTYERLMEPHFRSTADSAAQLGEAIVIHDPTEFRFGGESRRAGLGRVGGHSRGQGFYGYFSLALSNDGHRTPLGLLGLIPFFLTGAPRHRSWIEILQDPARKSTRWGQLVDDVEKRLGTRAQAIHVLDREADDYQLLQQLVTGKHRFVLRINHDRFIRDDSCHLPARERLRSAMDVVESELVREVPLSTRGYHRPKPNRAAHPPRMARMAWLHVRAKAISLLRPAHRAQDCDVAELNVNAIQIYEPAPPKGVAPVDWLLLSTEPIQTREQLGAIIDIYRARWVIEEYFKALKTGCAYEARQLESRDALLNALGLLAPAAVDLLRIRSVARDKPDAPASQAVTKTQIQVLRVFSKRHRLPSEPSVRDVLLAIAGLGGHLKNNGDPGWLTLHRGYERLRSLEEGWSAALATICDQS